MKWIKLNNPTANDIDVGDIIKFIGNQKAVVVCKDKNLCEIKKCSLFNKEICKERYEPIGCIVFNKDRKNYTCAIEKNVIAKRTATDDDLLKIIIKFKKESFRDDIKRLLKREK